MKINNYLFGTLLFALMTTISCHKVNDFLVKRVIVNDLLLDVKIEAFNDGEVVERIAIPPGSRHSKNEFCRDSRGNPTCFNLTGVDIRWPIFMDSVVAYFGDNKKSVYCSPGVSCRIRRNIMAFDLYDPEAAGIEDEGYVISKRGDTTVYTYTIGEADYELADWIVED